MLEAILHFSCLERLCLVKMAITNMNAFITKFLNSKMSSVLGSSLNDDEQLLPTGKLSLVEQLASVESKSISIPTVSTSDGDSHFFGGVRDQLCRSTLSKTFFDNSGFVDPYTVDPKVVELLLELFGSNASVDKSFLSTVKRITHTSFSPSEFADIAGSFPGFFIHATLRAGPTSQVILQNGDLSYFDRFGRVSNRRPVVSFNGSWKVVLMIGVHNDQCGLSRAFAELSSPWGDIHYLRDYFRAARISDSCSIPFYDCLKVLDFPPIFEQDLYFRISEDVVIPEKKSFVDTVLTTSETSLNLEPQCTPMEATMFMVIVSFILWSAWNKFSLGQRISDTVSDRVTEFTTRFTYDTASKVCRDVLKTDSTVEDVTISWMPTHMKDFLRRSGVKPVSFALWFFDYLDALTGDYNNVKSTLRLMTLSGNPLLISFAAIVPELIKHYLEKRSTVYPQALFDSIPSTSWQGLTKSAANFHTLMMAAKDVKCILDIIFRFLPITIRQYAANLAPDSAWYVLCHDLDPIPTMKTMESLLDAPNMAAIQAGSGEVRRKYTETASKIREIYDRLSNLDHKPGIFLALTQMQMRINQLNSIIDTGDRAHEARITPFCIMLIGDAGVGKTFAANTIANRLCPHSQIYARNVNGAYWDGFKPHHQLVMLEEVGQITKPEPLIEFLQVVSGSVYYPPLASIDNGAVGIKGTPLNCKYVVCTTNNERPNCADAPKIVDAIARRRHCLVRTFPYTTDKPFQIVESRDPNVPRSPRYNLEELMEAIAEEATNHFVVENAHLEHVKSAPTTHHFLYERLTGLKPQAPPVDDVSLAINTLIPSQVDIPKQPSWSLSGTMSTLLSVAQVLVTSYAAYKAYKSLFSKDVVPQGLYSEGVTRRVVVKKKPLSPQIQGAVESWGQNVHRITWNSPSGPLTVNCIHFDRVLLVPAHLFYMAPHDFGVVSLVFHHYSKVGGICADFPFEIEFQKISEFSYDAVDSTVRTMDISLIPLYDSEFRRIPSAPSLHNCFSDSIVGPTQVALVTRSKDGQLLFRYGRADRNQVTTKYGTSLQTFFTDDTWRYTFKTEDGDCGSMLLSTTGSGVKIIGLHSAFDSSACVGISTGLTKTLWNDMTSEFYSRPNTFAVQGKYPPQLENTRLSVLQNDVDQAHVATETKLRKSILYGAFPTNKEPAVLSPSDPRLSVDLQGQSVLLRAVAKMGNPGGGYNRTIFNRAVREVSRMMRRPSCMLTRNLTMHEAINGNESPKIKGMEMATSPGFPFIKMKDGKKQSFFEGDLGSYTMGPDLKALFEMRENMAKVGQIPESVWVNFLKDERRPIEKILSGSTRMVTIPPLDFQLLCRVYTHAFGEHCQLLQDSPCAVGINPSGMGWHLLALRLKKFNNFFDCDISNNDGEFPSELIMAVLDIINEYYDPLGQDVVSDTVRGTIFEELCYTVMLAGKTKYLKVGGNSTGQNLTTVVNTIGNIVQFYYTYYELLFREDCFLYEQDNYSFENNVSLAVFGDDNVQSVSDQASVFYSPEAIAASFVRVGRKVTDARKSPILNWVKFEDLSFLKRTFAKHESLPGYYVSLLEESVLQDEVQWYRKSDMDPISQTIDICNSALSEWAHYGKRHFSERRCVIEERLKFHLLTSEQVLFTYEDCLEILQRGYGMNVRAIRFVPQAPMVNIPRMCTFGPAGHSTKNITSGGVETQPPLNQYSSRLNPISELSGWDMSNAVDRMCFSRNINWTTSSAAGTNLSTINVPRDFIATNQTGTTQSMPFKNFYWMRGNCRIRLDVCGTKFHIGKLVAFFQQSPLTGTGSITVATSSFENCFGSTHAIIDASGASSVELEVPYFHQFDVVEPLNFEFSTFYIYVMQPLVATAGSDNTVTITVSACFPNSQFFTNRLTFGGPSLMEEPKFEKKKLISKVGRESSDDGDYVVTQGPMMQALAPVGEAVMGAVVKKVANVFESNTATDPTHATVPESAGSNPPTSSTNNVAVNVVSQNPLPVSLPPSGVSDFQRDQGVGDEAGKSKALASTITPPVASVSTISEGLIANINNPSFMTQYTRSNFINSRNLEHVYPARRDPTGKIDIIASDSGSDVDEMSVSFLTSRPGWMASGTITSTQTVGQNVAIIPVTPGLCYQEVAQISTLLTHYSFSRSFSFGGAMPWCAYLSLFSDWWTGDLDYTFVFSTGAFTSGKVLFTWYPAYDLINNNTTVTSLTQIGQTFSLVYDLASQDKRITIRVPWAARTPVIRTLPGNNFNGSADGWGTAFAQSGFAACNGVLQMKVYNQIATNNGSPANVPFDVFIAGGPRFQLSSPMTQNANTVMYDNRLSAMNTWLQSPLLLERHRDGERHDELKRDAVVPVTDALSNAVHNAVRNSPNDGVEHRSDQVRNPLISTPRTGQRIPTVDPWVELARGQIQGIVGIPNPNLRPQAGQPDAKHVMTSSSTTSTMLWSTEAVNIGPSDIHNTLSTISGESWTHLNQWLKSKSSCIRVFLPIAQTGPLIWNVPWFLLQVIPLPLLGAFYSMRGSIRLTFEVANPISDTVPSLGIAHLPLACNSITRNPATAFFITGNAARSVSRAAGTYFAPFLGLHPGLTSSSGWIVKAGYASLTVEIPYSWTTRFYTTSTLKGRVIQDSDAVFAENPWGWIAAQRDQVTSSTSTSDLNFNVWVSFGDDFHLGRCYQNPSVLVDPLGIDGVVPAPAWN